MRMGWVMSDVMKMEVPRCFRWNRCEAEKSARDILEGSRGSSEAIPPVQAWSEVAPRRGARTGVLCGESGIPPGCRSGCTHTGGIVAYGAPQPPATFWHPAGMAKRGMRPFSYSTDNSGESETCQALCRRPLAGGWQALEWDSKKSKSELEIHS